MTHWEKWIVTEELNAPCADISMSWSQTVLGQLDVLMHFSRIYGGYSKDLKITFSQAVSVRWEDESYGVHLLDGELPKFVQGERAGWTYPLLVGIDSPWLQSYLDHGAENVAHYGLVALNDLVEVIARPEPVTSWVISEDA